MVENFALAPVLTEKDPVEAAEGGIDPLGTEALADALAVRLVPGVRERQRHPRFLTAMAVAMEVCSSFDEEALAVDDVSPPWQVFEWYLVEGMVRTAENAQRNGLPGSLKAARAIADGVPLSAKRYLKTPTIFGFHGVYRQLARTLGIEDGGRLGEVGFELLRIWSHEQGLGGFVGSGGGSGQAVRAQFKEAVKDGLGKGATARNSTWNGWKLFHKHLAPDRAKPKEAAFIAAALLNDSKGFRREIMEFLVSPTGRKVWEDTRSERAFYRGLRTTAGAELRALLDAIDAFETFSRLCQDAFQDCLCELTRQGGKKTSPKALSALPSVQLAARRVPDAFVEAVDKLSLVNEVARCSETFSCLAERAVAADSAVAFLKLLDDPEERRNSIIFLTHGAMHRGLSDGWVKLAVMQRALHRRRHTEQLRRRLSRCAGKLLRLSWVERYCEDIWDRLLDSPPESWLKILRRHGIDPEGKGSLDSDDPVPMAVIQGLRGLDLTQTYAMLQELPQRYSDTYEVRIANARQLLTEELREVWRQCLNQLDFKLPLLVMDEAHHLKNPEARLSGLFQNPEARHDAEEISRGPLGGIFERMLFLTATPFQLGHHELCSVLERFEGVAWDATAAPRYGREAFRQQVREVRQCLDAAQASALNLDAAWGLLRAEDLVADGRAFGVDEMECWWAAVSSAASRTPAAEHVLAACHRTSERMRAAESALRPWVIRHLKERTFNGIPRRQRLAGQAIHSDNANGDERGISIGGEALLPFLLAARATACMPEARPVFAEGLASSYEAFLHTRKAGAESLDGDDDERPTAESEDEVANWYLNRLEEALPLNDHHSTAGHPKIAATARRVIELWQRGEKVVVFCHYVQTGRVLRQVISGLMTEEIYRAGAEKLGCASDEVEAELERLGLRFFDNDSPARRACDAQVAAALSRYPQLASHTAELQEVTRRYLRTPSFLVRFFPLSEGRLNEDSVNQAFTSGDASGLSLHDVLEGFFAFLAERCVEDERTQYLVAIRSIQTGAITGLDTQDAFAADERQGAAPERLLANVRLVNGAVKSETRQRLMLTFNSPFFPEVLIASSVMAEGVDLHRFCRHVIHHDLCWNPSTLEQRTGRVDRIGAKVERCGQPIRVYLPYLAETQDEKQYRVVMDRERWFSVIMGEKFDVDARSTEKLARRAPLPAALARELTLRLEIAQIEGECSIA